MKKNAFLFSLAALFPISFLVSCGGHSSDKYNFTYYDGHSIEVEVPKGEDVRDHYPKNTESHDDGYKEYTYTWEYKQFNNYQEKQNETKISTDFTFIYADGRLKKVEVPRNHSVEEYFPTDHSETTYYYGTDGKGTKTEYVGWAVETETTYVETSTEISIYNITYVIPDGATNPSINPTWVEHSTKHTLQPAEWTGYRFTGWYKGQSQITEIKDTVEPITLTAKFEAIKYDIEYHLDNGINSPNNPSQYTVATPVVLEDASKEGYAFKGWFLDKDFKNKITTIENRTGKLDLWAKFVDIEYPITYYLNGGTNSENNPDTYTVNDEFTFDDATKTGYTFDGWYTDNQFQTSITGISKGTMGPKSLYAKFTKIDYGITYNLDGGTNNPSNPSTFTIEDSISLKDPTKTGYDFNGWYEDADFTIKITNIINRSEDLVLWANFSIKTYGITYHLDGGTNPEGNPKTYTVNNEVTLLNANKTGYTFDGWYKESSFDNKIEKINAGTTGDLDLWAKFTAISYTIDYHLNGGTNASDNPTTYTIESEKTLSPATKTECVFDGWYKESDFKTQVTSLNGLHEHLELWAKFTENIYTITYVLDEGENPNQTTYTYYDNVSLKPAIKTGYTFSNWYLDQGRTIATTGWAAKSTYGDKTIYGGDFTPTPYSITYVLDGGTNPEDNPKNYTIESDDITLLDAYGKVGHVFKGWYKDSGFKEKITSIEQGSVGDITLYAKFDPNSYKVTLDADGGYFINQTGCVYLDYCIDGYETKKVEFAYGATYNPNTENIPEIQNYIFAGWYKDQGYTQALEKGDAVESGSTLYAKWDAKTTYDSITSIMDQVIRPSTSEGSLDVTYNYVLPAQFKKIRLILYHSGKNSGYDAYHSRFIISVNGDQYIDTGTVYNSSYEYADIYVPSSTISIEVKGAYRAGSGPIPFEGKPSFLLSSSWVDQPEYRNDKSFSFDNSKWSSEIEYLSTFNPPTPKKDGFTFAGWYDEQGNPYTPGIWEFTEEKKFIAHWN